MMVLMVEMMLMMIPMIPGVMTVTMAAIPPSGRENFPADFSLPEPFFSLWFPPRGGGGKIPLRYPRCF